MDSGPGSSGRPGTIGEMPPHRDQLKIAEYPERQLAAGNVHAAELRAAVQLGEDLAGVQQALVVEGAVEPLLLVGSVSENMTGIRSHFSTPNTVLAGQHAAASTHI